jgi:hypothetical protein
VLAPQKPGLIEMRSKTNLRACLTDLGREYKPGICRVDQRPDLPLQGLRKTLCASAAGPSAREVLP